MGKSIDNYGYIVINYNYNDCFIVFIVNYDAEYADCKEMWTHLHDSSRSIEVNYVTKNDEEILSKVYFPFSPSVRYSTHIILASIIIVILVQ